MTVEIIRLEGRFFPQTCCGVKYTNSKALMDHFLPVHMAEGRRRAIEARMADLREIELSLLGRLHSAREEISQLEATLLEMS